MKKEKINSCIEVYVCNHSRDKDEDCASKGAKGLTDELKKWAKETHKGEIKVVRSGCLGMCTQGIAMSCYPEKNFVLEINPEDIQEIKEGLLEALFETKDQ